MPDAPCPPGTPVFSCFLFIAESPEILNVKLLKKGSEIYRRCELRHLLNIQVYRVIHTSSPEGQTMTMSIV